MLNPPLQVAFLSTMLTMNPADQGPAVYEVLAAPETLAGVRFSVAGRDQRIGEAAPDIAYSSSGISLETAFRGDRLYFKLGAGAGTLRVIVDGYALPIITKPTPGYYEIGDLDATAVHRVQVEARANADAGSGHFYGFYVMQVRSSPK